MSGRRTLERSVTRMQRLTAVVVAFVTVAVGVAAGAAWSLRADDATSLSLAAALVTELEDHARDDRDDLVGELRNELREQAAFGREVAIYAADGVLLGATDVGRLLRVATVPSAGCATEPVGKRDWRVCSQRASTGAWVRVAAPLERLTRATEALLLALLVAAVAASVVSGVVSRRIVRNALRPLEELRSGVSGIPGTASTDLAFSARWGVSEIDSVAAAFDGLLARVRLAVERERRFVADASHELRTPLTRIRGQLELLALEPTAPDAPAMMLAAQRSCDLLVRTTEALLALAREDPVLTETVDLAELAASVSETIDGRVEDRSAPRLVVQADEETLVRGNPELLRLAISNLVENALKYSEGRVVVRATPAIGGVVQLTVSDEGPGIPAPDVERLLRPFARGTAVRARGTGLGLSLVEHVARTHRGTLVLGPAESGGLRASLELPEWTAT